MTLNFRIGFGLHLRDRVFLIVFLATTLTGLLLVAIQPRPGNAVAVIMPPWETASRTLQAIATADGRYMRQGLGGWVAIASSDRPDFAARLYAAGAWLVADPLVAGACIAERRS